MSERTMTIAEVRQILTTLDKHPLEETLIVTNNTQPYLTLIPYHLYNELLANVASLQNVLEVMASSLQGEIPRTPRPEKLVASDEKRTSWEEFKAEVGWE